MANEATQIEGPYLIRDFTVANGSSGTDIEQGTLMKQADPRTCSAGTGTGEAFAGILATEKVGGNGKTEIGVWQTGVFKLTAAPSGTSISAGNNVCMSGANLIRECVAGDLLTGAVVGVAMEDIADGTTGEVNIGIKA